MFREKGCVGMQDIYFEENYGRLFEKIEKGIFQVFTFPHMYGTVKHSFIMREIPLPVRGETYYDLVTPYGYGGPQILQCEEGRKAELVEAFEAAFQEYCTERRIVSEFIRFHPVLNNAEDFLACYDVAHVRDTVGTNLKDHDQPVEVEFSKSARKNIRQALKAGVEYRVTRNPDDLSEFKNIYYATMERNHADTYYFFGDEYFDQLIRLLGENVLLVEVLYEGRVIGAGLNFVYKNLAHTHLSGTLAEFNCFSPASILNYALTLWAKEHGIDVIHGGGGRTNSADDNLFVFKKQFGRQTAFKFYTGRKIWNGAVYQELCAVFDLHEETEFFPAYRSKSMDLYERV
ncbi:GNAT family N-acetyltransferase [Planococcus liqunii]|uniref:Lipid II:glycine glycyltransferase n=1 Tax=Planococcus liqunii TaxID=3058394 RepID=A0ABT8MT67_9BACL|nr:MULTISPECIES: GNAT family N-acetyltransferase [unclassified Planococcus (in: firmicutes)]MDN7227921.1 GNAT family N-acetyltransferase [Planococcus sp. N064]WKA50773.1 GNAT family N-acetyltransferase [Planococcus sp. N056]